MSLKRDEPLREILQIVWISLFVLSAITLTIIIIVVINNLNLSK